MIDTCENVYNMSATYVNDWLRPVGAWPSEKDGGITFSENYYITVRIFKGPWSPTIQTVLAALILLQGCVCASVDWEVAPDSRRAWFGRLRSKTGTTDLV